MLELSRKAKKILSFEDSLEDEASRIFFQHAVLCQVGMPRKLTKGRSFERRSGLSSLLLEAGNLWNGEKWVEQSLPYGPKPRLIMMHLSSQAIRTRSPIVDVGSSIRQFLTTLALPSNGENYAMFKKQMEALAACRLLIGIANSKGATTINTHPIKSFEAWLHPTAGKPILWPGRIELSQEFFETLLEYAVPMPYEALHRLKDSALDLDVFSWLTHRLCRIDKPSGVLVTWENLKAQFGQEYKRISDFKKQIKISLRYALASYPEANISQEDNGIKLYSSRPPIKKCTLFMPARKSK